MNLGANRWSFKPELGVSRASGRWTVEGFAGVWLYTSNSKFSTEKREPRNRSAPWQFHLGYTLWPRFWAGFDANCSNGGRTSINGATSFDLQQNSRMGGTLAIPLNRHQSFKLSYSHGAHTTIGGNFNSIGISYQYLWAADSIEVRCGFRGHKSGTVDSAGNQRCTVKVSSCDSARWPIALAPGRSGREVDVGIGIKDKAGVAEGNGSPGWIPVLCHQSGSQHVAAPGSGPADGQPESGEGPREGIGWRHGA